MSRLDYAPKLKEIQITDIQKGLGVFTPKLDKPASFAALKETLKKAGYTLDAADITVAGILAKNDKVWAIVVQPSGQRFALQGNNVQQMLAGAVAGTQMEITGDWKTIGAGATAYEAISPAALKASTGVNSNVLRPVLPSFAQVSFTEAKPSVVEPANLLPKLDTAKPPAPIRVTSPGLTVYRGGAVTPRLFFIKQHLGDVEVHRQVFNLSVSYTPTPRLQLEIEAPFSRTAYDKPIGSGSGFGLGNITTWAKYRFFRKVKTYGDRQAALRVGLELPTGKKTAPTQAQINKARFCQAAIDPNQRRAHTTLGCRILSGRRSNHLWRKCRSDPAHGT